uniref:Ig-like domain-containing protein n=1 Tax=Hucho hucho TaxID=62062 RepID=A0A4W5Q932_9TELE
MADIHHSFLGLLVTVLYLLTGVSGETLSMFSRVGDDVSLPCNNVVYPNCSSTVWNYNRAGSTVTIEVVALGKIKDDKTERLSLGSDCSLHVSNVRAEDAGRYTCQQFLTETGSQHGGDAPVDLSVLTISSTTPVTDLTPDADMTLRCSLFSFMGHGTQCISGVSLSWVLNETGTEPQKYSGSQDPQHSSCDITLTVTLQKKDNNRKWTCTLTEKGNVKISIDFTSTFSGPQNLFLTVSVGVAVVAAVCVTAAVIIVRRKREKNQVPTDNSIGLNAVNHSTPPTNEDKSQPDDRITYASIDHFNQNPPQRVDVQGEDAVMYASVMPSSTRGRETENPADPSSLYSTVNKPQGAKTST